DELAAAVVSVAGVDAAGGDDGAALPVEVADAADDPCVPDADVCVRDSPLPAPCASVLSDGAGVRGSPRHPEGRASAWGSPWLRAEKELVDAPDELSVDPSDFVGDVDLVEVLSSAFAVSSGFADVAL